MKSGSKTQLILLGMLGAIMAFIVTTYATQKYVDIKHDAAIDKINYIHDDVKEIKRDIKQLIRRK